MSMKAAIGGYGHMSGLLQFRDDPALRQLLWRGVMAGGAATVD